MAMALAYKLRHELHLLVCFLLYRKSCTEMSLRLFECVQIIKQCLIRRVVSYEPWYILFYQPATLSTFASLKSVTTLYTH